MRELSTEELIRRGCEAQLLDVRTSMAATVVSFDANTMTATIRPGVRVQVVDSDSDPEVDTLPPVEGVDVLFPSAGGFLLFAPLEAGDVGRLEWSEEDDGDLYDDASAAVPVNPRILKRHGGNAVFRPEGFRGVGALGAEDSGKMLLGKPGGSVVQFDGDELKLGRSDATEKVVLSGKFKTTWNVAMDAAVVAAQASPGDGGEAGFAAMKTALTSVLIEATKVKAK